MENSNSNLERVLNPSRPTLAGQLLKYTNVMKGWQIRYFTVDPRSGILSYYLCEEMNAPRGQVQLSGAIVVPSDESERSFIVNTASGEILKLRAPDARTRQEWVDGLREICQALSIASTTPLSARESLAACDAFGACRAQLQQTESRNASLIRTIEQVSAPLSPTDPDLLILKALSSATTNVLFQCLGILQKQGSGSSSSGAGIASAAEVVQ